MLIPTNRWNNDIAIDGDLVERNLNEIKNNIAHCKVKIIAVTKYFGLKAIEAGYKVGLRDFAESRVQDGVEKIESLPEEIRKNSTFHFIGHLQSNKVKAAVRHFDIIHSVDSLKIAKAISEAACLINKREKVLLQVNNAGEEQKSGYSKEELIRDFGDLMQLSGIEIIGLMNMAPLGASETELTRLFSDVCVFRSELEEKFNVELKELSMGMSDDYVVAVREGATMVRIGRKLFM